MLTAKYKLSWITKQLKAGKTIYISTYTKCTKVSPKTYARWKEDGYPLFKVSGTSLYMARGKKFDCIDYCQLEAI